MQQQSLSKRDGDAWAGATGQSQVDEGPCGVAVLDDPREARRVVRVITLVRGQGELRESVRDARGEQLGLVRSVEAEKSDRLDDEAEELRAERIV